MKALKITTTGEVTVIDIDSNEFLDTLYREIDCSMVECVSISEGIDLWCDEEGRFTDKEINRAATFMAVVELEKYDRGLIAPLVGDVVVTGIDYENGESIGLTEEQINHLTPLAR